jgi:hypothetical protein
MATMTAVAPAAATAPTSAPMAAVPNLFNAPLDLALDSGRIGRNRSGLCGEAKKRARGNHPSKQVLFHMSTLC